MLTCIVRPVINKKFINFDVTEFTKLSEFWFIFESSITDSLFSLILSSELIMGGPFLKDDLQEVKKIIIKN